MDGMACLGGCFTLHIVSQVPSFPSNVIDGEQGPTPNDFTPFLESLGILDDDKYGAKRLEDSLGIGSTKSGDPTPRLSLS